MSPVCAMLIFWSATFTVTSGWSCDRIPSRAASEHTNVVYPTIIDNCQLSRLTQFGVTLVPEKSVQYVAQFLASADLNCACARFCYSVSPWVTFQKFWNIKWIKICVYCYFNIFMLRRRILQRKRKFRRPLSSMWGCRKGVYRGGREEVSKGGSHTGWVVFWPVGSPAAIDNWAVPWQYPTMLSM